MADKRIIELTEKQWDEVNSDDYIVTDNGTDGTKKVNAKYFMGNAGMQFPDVYGIKLPFPQEDEQNVVLCSLVQPSQPISCTKDTPLTVNLTIPSSTDMPTGYDAIGFNVFIGNCFVEGGDSDQGLLQITSNADIVEPVLRYVDSNHVSAVIRPHHSGNITKIQFNCIAHMVCEY